MNVKGLISWEIDDTNRHDLDSANSEYVFTGTLVNTSGANLTLRIWSNRFDGGKCDIIFGSTGNLYIEQLPIGYLQCLTSGGGIKLILAKLVPNETEPDVKIKYTA